MSVTRSPMSQCLTCCRLLEKIKSRRARTGVVGLGYVGLPLAVELGQGRVPRDRHRPRRPEGRGHQPRAAPTFPTSRPPTSRRCTTAGKLDATTDFAVVKELDTINICVPTPLRKTKDPDMSYIVSAVESIAKHLHPGLLVILESTTYPGTTDEVVQPLLEATGLKAGEDFFLAFSPERVDPGNPTFQTHNVPKVVGGLTPGVLELASALYGAAIETIVPVSSTRVAEMVKLLENTFRAVNIGLVNELALMCDRMDIDVWEVVDAAKTKPFGFMAFYPGPGLGGHCIPIDPFYLSWKAKQSGFDPRFIELAGHINGGMPHYVVDKVAEALNTKRKAINGSQDPDRRRRLQARHRRHARVAGARRHGPAARDAARRCRTPIRTCRKSTAASGRGASTSRRSTQARGIVRPVRLHRHRSPTTRRSTTTRWSRKPTSSSIPGTRSSSRRPTCSSSGAPRPEEREPRVWPDRAHAVTADAEERGGSRSRWCRGWQQLVVVVEHVQLDVRSRSRPALDRVRIDRGVAASLEDLDRQIDTRVERVVARRRPRTARSAPASGGRSRSERRRGGRCGCHSSTPRSPRSRSRLPPKSSAGASSTRRSTRAG